MDSSKRLIGRCLVGRSTSNMPVIASVLLLTPATSETDYSSVLGGLLGDIADHRALLACDVEALRVAIEALPQNVRIRAFKRLARIKNAHRLVAPEAPMGTECHGLWSESDDMQHGVLGPTTCACRGECAVLGAIPLKDYPDSDLYDMVRHSGGYSKPRGVTHPEEFEREVMKRWFRQTRWVQVVDWFCGIGWQKTSKWRDNLGWIAGALSEYSRVSEPEFQLRTELPDSDPDLVKIDMEKTIVEAGCRAIVVPTIKRTANFAHGRYLQTEQGWWRLDGGIDWKRANGRLATVDISAIDDFDASQYNHAFPRIAGNATH